MAPPALEWSGLRKGAAHRGFPRSFSRVHLEIDLEPEVVREWELPILRQLEALLREREVIEVGDLLRLVGGVLHAFSAAGFDFVDHWEAEPGGWLPLPETPHRRIDEPIAHLLRALKSARWQPIANARGFAMRLSGRSRGRADVVVRRFHRERLPSLSIDLRGSITTRQVRLLVRAVQHWLPVLRARVTESDARGHAG